MKPTQESKDMKFTVYELMHNGEIRYVGYTKRSLEARLQSHVRAAKRGADSHCARWIRKLLSVGCSPKISIITERLTKEDAFRYERIFIDAYREEGLRLTNMTDGGEGGSTGPRSEETRRKIGESNRGRIISVESRAKQSATMKGRTLSAEHRKKVGEAQLGSKRSDEQKANMKAAQQRLADSDVGRAIAARRGLGLKGRKRSEAVVQMLRSRVASEETRKKISEAARRRGPVSEDTRQKLRDAATQRNRVDGRFQDIKP